jgi:hypothetical protein
MSGAVTGIGGFAGTHPGRSAASFGSQMAVLRADIAPVEQAALAAIHLKMGNRKHVRHWRLRRSATQRLELGQTGFLATSWRAMMIRWSSLVLACTPT